jgi:hypothetical protein
MIVLSASQSLTAILSTTPSSALSFSISYAPTGGAVPADSSGTISTNTETTLLAAPSSGTSYVIGSISVYNSDTTARKITIQKYNGTTYYPLYSATLQSGWTLSYSGAGWVVSDTNGSTVGTFPYTTNQANGFLILDSNGNAPLANLPPVLQFGLKNYIINGNFDFWQRGTSLSIAAGGIGYLADRFLSQSIAGSTGVVSQQSFTLGQGVVPFEPTYFHRTVVTSVAGSGNGFRTQHKIESVRSLAGQTCTVSFWAKADSSKNIAIQFNQAFGSGGSPSATVVGIGSQLVALTSSWQQFKITIAIPSISGKTLGTNNNDALVLNIWYDAGSSFTEAAGLGQQSGTFDIAQIQVEAGSYATSFDIRPPELELALCQRYYEKSYNLTVNPGTANATSGRYIYYVTPQIAGYNAGAVANSNFQVSAMVYFKTTKRGLPTITGYSSATGASGVVSDVPSNTDVTANFAGDYGYNSFCALITPKNSGSVNVQFHWTADADI